MAQNPGLFYQFQTINANNAAVRLHEQRQLQEAYQMYTIALNSLAVVQRSPSTTRRSDTRKKCFLDNPQFLPSCCIAVESFSQPLLIKTEQLLHTGSCSVLHQSLVIHYNIGLVLLHLGDSRQAASMLDQIMSTDMLQKSGAHPTFVVSLYYNMGYALHGSTISGDKFNEETALRALYLFREAARIGKSFLGGSHIMMAHVLSALGKVLTKKGDFITAMVTIEDALKIYEQAGVKVGVESESSYAQGAPSA